MVKNTPAKAGDTRDTGSIPRSGRSPGGRHGNPRQCSGLENAMDRVPGGLRSQGRKELDTTECTHMHTHTHYFHIPDEGTEFQGNC